jgi:hypothetical protein
MATSVKHTTYPTAPSYGSERWYWEQAILGQGASAPLILTPSKTGLGNNVGANAQPCASEIASITRTSAGLYVVTLFDAYYAIAYAGADIDDSAGLGAYATVGNWTNLNTSTPTQFNLRTWNASGSTPTDIPLNTVCYIHVAFKKTWTGSAA